MKKISHVHLWEYDYFAVCLRLVCLVRNQPSTLILHIITQRYSTEGVFMKRKKNNDTHSIIIITEESLGDYAYFIIHRAQLNYDVRMDVKECEHRCVWVCVCVRVCVRCTVM